jgi:hypothetical protein
MMDVSTSTSKRPREEAYDDDDLDTIDDFDKQEIRRRAFHSFPFQSTVWRHKGQGSMSTSTHDPSHGHLLPPNFPTSWSDQLEFTLLSADIICKYYSAKESPSTSTAWALGHVRDILNSKENIAALFGGVSSAAYTFLRSPVISILKTWSQYFYGNPTFDTLLDSLVLLEQHSLGPYIWPTTLGLVGLLSTHTTVRYVSNQIRKRRNKRSRIEAVKEYYEETDEILHTLDSAASKLKTSCRDIYCMLCMRQNPQQKHECQHSEPSRCREQFLMSFPDFGYALLDYTKLPDKIIQTINSENTFDGVVNLWKSAINNFPEAANEVGLILSIVYVAMGLIASKSRMNELASKVNETFFSGDSVEMYVYWRMVRGCLISTLLSDDDEYHNWMETCYTPSKGVSEELKNEYDRVWNWMEIELGMSLKKVNKLQSTVPEIPIVVAGIKVDDSTETAAENILNHQWTINRMFSNTPIRSLAHMFHSQQVQMLEEEWVVSVWSLVFDKAVRRYVLPEPNDITETSIGRVLDEMLYFLVIQLIKKNRLTELVALSVKLFQNSKALILTILTEDLRLNDIDIIESDWDRLYRILLQTNVTLDDEMYNVIQAAFSI